MELFMTLVFPFIALLIGFALGRLMEAAGVWRFLLLFLLAQSLVPALLHLLYVKDINEIYPSGPYVDPTSFIASSVLIAGVSLLVGFAVTWRVPPFAPLFPLLFGLIYYNVPFATFYDELYNNELLLEGIINAWLLWLSLAASAALFGYVLARYLEPHILKAYFPLR